MAGTARTTPPLSEVSADWPTPWLFARALLAILLVFGVLWFAWESFRNINLVPGLILTGAFASPIAAALFFYEVNVLKNASIILVAKMMFLGGVISLLVALFLFEASEGLVWWMGASSAGILEELAKLIAVVFMVRGALAARFPFILNGMLFGAAVGTGFAAFESAGYAMRIGFAAGSDEMIGNIIDRGLLAPLAHVVWTAITAGALWRIKGGNPFEWGMLWDKRVYPLILLSIGLHFLWNTPLSLPFHSKFLVLGFVAWVAAIALIQAGLRQVAEAKREALAVEAPTTAG